MRLHLASLASAALAALSLLASPALAVCKGDVADGKCEPPDDDCACEDCMAACTGACTASNPPACTFEDACTCKDCWTDSYCTDPEKKNCTDNAKCDFFKEGCCCADCAGLAQCANFDGVCGAGTGGAAGAGGTSGAAGSAGSGGNGGSGGGGGSGVDPTNKEGCGCSAAGVEGPGQAGLVALAAGLSVLARRRRREKRAS